MTLKNKMRLQQFDDPALLGGLLNLPGRMMAEASRERTPSVADARIAQLAIANEILLMAPLRIKNISELEVGRTLFLGAGKVGYILIDHTEIKNELDIEAPLPASTVQMIELYLKRFHPLLAPPGCKMLFPSRDGGHKRTTVLSHQISVCARRRCGVAMNPHLFRHLAAKIYLDAFPGSYGVIRMLLGHKSIDTTTRTYCGMEFVAAFHLYDAYLNKVRSAGSPTEVRPTKGRS